MVRQEPMRLYLYKKGICDPIKEPELFIDLSNQAIEIERLLSKKTNCIDELRDMIAESYSFNKDYSLPIYERIYYIKGLIYGKNYINRDELVSFCRDVMSYQLASNDKDSVFSKILYEDDLKKDVIENINNNDKDEMYNDEFIIFCDDEEFEAEGDIDIMINKDEFFRSFYASPKDRLDYMKKNFDLYKKYVLNTKNINNDIPKKYVLMGLNDWFDKVYSIYLDSYEFLTNQGDDNNKSLFKTL